MMGPCYIRDLLPSFHVPQAHHFSHTGLLDGLQTCQASSHFRAFIQCLLEQSYIKQNSPRILAPCSALFLHTGLRTMTLDHIFSYSPVYCLPSPLECKHHEGKNLFTVISPAPSRCLAQGRLPKRIYRMNK